MKVSNVLGGLVMAFTMGVTSLSYAQEDLMGKSLEELLNTPVVTVSRRSESMYDTPGIISVITAKEIRDFGANSLFEILNRAPSFQMLGSNAWVQNLASVRGDLATHIDTRVLILFNGRPMREGLMGGWNFPVYTAFPVDMIERIEIIRGPGSVLYGSNAFDAIINIITKEPKIEVLKFSASTGAGSFKAARETWHTMYAKGGLKFSAGAMYFNEEGWTYKAKDRFGIYDEMKFGEENTGTVANLSYTPDKGDTVVTLSTFLAKHSNDMFGILPYWSQIGNAHGVRFVGDVGLVRKITEDWAVHGNITNNYHKLHLEYPATPADYEASELSSDWLYEMYLTGRIFDKLNIILGGLSDNLYRPSNQINSALTKYHQRRDTAYVQADYRLLEQLTFTVGMQELNVDTSDRDTVRRLGAVYHFNDRWGTKLLYGEAYRSPYPAELFSDIPVLRGNPELRPEQIATTDWQLFHHTDGLDCALTLYYSRYTDPIVRSGVNYINGTGAELGGIELEGKKNIAQNLYIEGSMTYNDKMGNSMLSPSFMAKLGISYTLASRLTVGLFDTFFAAPRAVSAPVENPKATSVNLVDLNFTYKLPTRNKIELNLYTRNLLDQDYDFVEYNKQTMMTTLPQGAGRAIYGKVSVEF